MAYRRTLHPYWYGLKGFYPVEKVIGGYSAQVEVLHSMLRRMAEDNDPGGGSKLRNPVLESLLSENDLGQKHRQVLRLRHDSKDRSSPLQPIED